MISDPNGSVEVLTRWALYGAIAGIVYLAFSFISDRTFASMATKALYKLQTNLFSNIQTLSMGFFYKNPPGELSSNVTNDAEVVSLFYTSAVSQLIRAIFQILMILIVMLVINWRLAIVALVTVPFLLASIYVVTRIASPAFAKLQESLGEVSGFQEETLTGHKVVISKRRQEWVEEEHEKQAAGVYHVGKRSFPSRPDAVSTDPNTKPVPECVGHDCRHLDGDQWQNHLRRSDVFFWICSALSVAAGANCQPDL